MKYVILLLLFGGALGTEDHTLGMSAANPVT